MPRSFWADGSAMLTIEASRMIISCATAITPRASQRLGSGASDGEADPGVGVLSVMGISLQTNGGLGFQGDGGTVLSLVPDADRFRRFRRAQFTVGCLPVSYVAWPTVGP